MKSRKNTGDLHSTISRELSSAATLVLSPRVTSTLHVPKMPTWKNKANLNKCLIL